MGYQACDQLTGELLSSLKMTVCNPFTTQCLHFCSAATWLLPWIYVTGLCRSFALCFYAGGDAWRITGEERARHDAQFFTLKPVNGYISGMKTLGRD